MFYTIYPELYGKFLCITELRYSDDEKPKTVGIILLLYVSRTAGVLQGLVVSGAT